MNVDTPKSIAPNHRILLVDDNEAIHEDFRKILEPSPIQRTDLDTLEATLLGTPKPIQNECPFETDSALQGQQALDKLLESIHRNEPYSLAFVDMQMPPGWDGLKTIEKLWEVYPCLHVVICTAYSDHNWDDLMNRLGHTGRLIVLKKPFDVVEVKQLANTLTEKWRLEQQEKLRLAQLEKTMESQSKRLHENQQKFQLITEHAGDLISLLDPERHRIYCSPSFEPILGYPPKQLLQTDGFKEIHPEDRTVAVDTATAVFENGQSKVVESRVQHRDGTWKTIESRLSVVRQSNKKAAHLVVVSRDITDRRLAEEENRRMEIQLRHSQKMESIGQLAAGIAHEINTPIQFIGDNLHFLNTSFAEILPLLPLDTESAETTACQHGETDSPKGTDSTSECVDREFLTEEIPSAIKQSLEGVDRVSQIVKAMKEFSHPGLEQKIPLDINKAIESTVIVCRNEWKYVAKLTTHFDVELPPVPLLPGEFNQVILNLVVNAAHAIGDTGGGREADLGEICITTQRKNDAVEILISDTGSGIPVGTRNRVFDPFFTTKEVGKGTGQGLAIAHSVITDKHQGSISLESSEGKGTTFTIRLPIASKNSPREEK